MGYNHQSTPLAVYKVVPRCGGARPYPTYSLASDKFPVEEFKEVAGKYLALTSCESGDPDAAAAFLKEKEGLIVERNKVLVYCLVAGRLSCSEIAVSGRTGDAGLEGDVGAGISGHW